MLIIGSAAGVVVMGLEKITFGWYMKKITWIAFVGYIAGILSYYLIRSFIFKIPIVKTKEYNKIRERSSS